MLKVIFGKYSVDKQLLTTLQGEYSIRYPEIYKGKWGGAGGQQVQDPVEAAGVLTSSVGG